MGPSDITTILNSLSALFMFRCHFASSWVALSFQSTLCSSSSPLGGLSSSDTACDFALPAAAERCNFFSLPAAA
eukprot:8188455-Pyramimonas_sp.AAC.1